MEQQMQTLITELPNELQMVILNFIGLDKKRDWVNHNLIACTEDHYDRYFLHGEEGLYGKAMRVNTN